MAHDEGGETAPHVSHGGNFGEAETIDIANKILAIISAYALDKLDVCKERFADGTPRHLSVIEQFIKAGEPVNMCLPGFPFKSANKVDKVFGILPDKAEELALERLDIMCQRIGDIYHPGAFLTIVSDGLVYNDLLCISERDTWAYGEAVRAIVSHKGFTSLRFSRLRDLVNTSLPETQEEITYIANATNFRRLLLNEHGKDDLDIDNEIATNANTLMTYRGYCRFLESDLKHIFPTSAGGLTHRAYKRNVKYLAKQMLTRGYAFAGAVKHAYPNHLRLSIHQSTGEHKVSISLLDTSTGYTTPWHCCVAQMANGQWMSGLKHDFQNNPKLGVVLEAGRPCYFQYCDTDIARVSGDDIVRPGTSRDEI